MSAKPRIVPLSRAPERNHSGRVPRTRTGERLRDDEQLRDDEPTRVAPLPYGSAPDAVEPPSPQSPRSSRITRAPAQREEVGAHYHVRNPEHGTTSVLPPARRSAPPSRPPSIPASAFADADAHFAAAERLLQRGDARGAVLTAQKAMKIAPPRPAQQALYAWLLYVRDGRSVPIHEHVFRHLDQALFRDADCVDAHCFKGVLLARIGQLSEARDHLRRALELEPDNRAAARALQLMDGEV